jgi:predicted transcriptional regulator
MGTRTWKSLKSKRLAPKAVATVAARAKVEILELTLKQLRNGLDVTQADLARAADMTQSEMSRLESRDDHRVSSLRRYVEALGGEIEITALIGGRRVKLTDV